MDKMLTKIEACDDPTLLKQWVKNGTIKGEAKIVRAARLRLYSILPAAEPGSLEHDVWASIFALEELEAERRGKTVRLQRTRTLIRDVGERECVERLLLKSTPSSGFAMLVDYQMPHLLFEAVALRHRDQFSAEAIDNAEARMSRIGPEKPAEAKAG